MSQGFSGGSVVKNPPAKAGDTGGSSSIPGFYIHLSRIDILGGY